jgi:hypothetical protein
MQSPPKAVLTEFGVYPSALSQQDVPNPKSKIQNGITYDKYLFTTDFS